MDEAGAARLTVAGPTVDWVAVAGGSAWVAVGNAVKRLDGDDGAELATIPMPGETCLAMDVGFGSVWVGVCRAGVPMLVRINPGTGKEVARIKLDLDDLQYESSVAAGEGAVWALELGGKRLVKIDPASNRVTTTFELPGGLGGVRAGLGGVWIAAPAAGQVLRVDPATGAVVVKIKVGPGPQFLAIGDGAVWAMNARDGTVSRIDPVTNAVVATIPVSPNPIEGGDISFGGGAIWARVTDQLVARIDPARNAVVARYGPPAGSGGVAADDTAAWISAHDVNAVWRLPLR